MPLRFPQPSTPTTPIASPTPLIAATALYVWPVAVNSGGNDYAHYFVTGDAQTSVISRAAVAGLAFNSTTGVMSKSTSGASTPFIVPDNLLTLSSSGPFSVMYIHKTDSANGILIDMALIANGSGYGVSLYSGGGAGIAFINAISSGWSQITSPSYFPDDATAEKFYTYTHTTGDQKFYNGTSVAGTSSTATSCGLALNTSTYPIKTGSAVNAGSRQESSWIGTIIVPTALSSGDISTLVNATGLLVSAGGSSTYKPRRSLLGVG